MKKKTAAKKRKPIGKQLLIVHITRHWDRAGETGTTVFKMGEILTIDTKDEVIADTKKGEHLRCPASKLYPLSETISACLPRKFAKSEYFAVEEIVRDFHSGNNPLTIKWLNAKKGLEKLMQPR